MTDRIRLRLLFLMACACLLTWAGGAPALFGFVLSGLSIAGVLVPLIIDTIYAADPDSPLSLHWGMAIAPLLGISLALGLAGDAGLFGWLAGCLAIGVMARTAWGDHDGKEVLP